jgi:hypothetical protein
LRLGQAKKKKKKEKAYACHLSYTKNIGRRLTVQDWPQQKEGDPKTK